MHTDFDDPIVVKLFKARVRMLFEEPLFGQLIMRLDMQDASGWCNTAATNGRTLFYNRDFIERLHPDEVMFVLAHEVRHVLFGHIGRRGQRDKEVWNSAVDFVANYGLVRDGIGKMPACGLYDERYNDDLSSEQVYDLLLQDLAMVGTPLDMHLEPSDGSGQAGEDPLPLPAPGELAELRNEFIADLLRAAASLEPGKVSLGMRRFIDGLLTPQFDWRQIIASTLRSMVRFDYTYARPSRRAWASDLVLPGQDVTQRVEAVAWLDGSASTTQTMITAFLSECAGIMASFNDFCLTIGTFDTDVYSVQTFTPANANDILSYPYKGGGGTAPSVCWTYMREHQMRPDKILVFSDGAVGQDWGDATLADTLFVIHSNPKVTAPHGTTCHFVA